MSAKQQPWYRALYREPRFTRLRNLRLYEWMGANAPGKLILNLGSGTGRFDHHLPAGLNMVKLDINPKAPGVQVLADAHRLPFGDTTFDIVYSVAVLEHVQRPWLVADEIRRVLKPGGHVVLELPFLNVIHAEHDYFRFTDRGIRALFDQNRFEPVLEQVGSGGGSFLSVFLTMYVRNFVPTRFLKDVWFGVAGHVLSLLRYADVLVDRSEELRLTANSFSFIGRKKG